MKKSAVSTVGIIVILVVIGVIWYKSTPSNNDAAMVQSGTNVSPTASAPSTAVTKVSDKVSGYQNAELGFAVKYPTTWEKEDAVMGVSFVMPIDKAQVSTIAKLQADVSVVSGKCAFPPVTTVKDRSTLTVGRLSLNMISMTNNVQGRAYFNRMYSLQQGDVCYLFSFASIALSPASKNLTGSNLTQAENNNKAIVNSSDSAFTDMVKSFEFVTGPQGQDETKVAPAK